MSITFGSDPEFMLQDEDGNLKSAIEVVPGTKEDRHDLGDGHAVYYDNVLAECSIRPGKSSQDAVDSHRQCFQRYAHLVAPYRLATQASGNYPANECAHKEAQQFGCDPEFCAYELAVIEPPECAGHFRSAGGHLHIGFNGGVDFTPDQVEADVDLQELNIAVGWNRLWVIRMADLFIGIPSLLLDKDPTSRTRRKLYGVAGSHRPCETYGVEYRSLGNFWLSSPSLVALMYDLAQFCVKTVMEDHRHEEIWDKHLASEDVRRTINTWDMGTAEKHMVTARQYLPEGLASRIDEEMGLEGTHDFYKQWEIKL